MEKEEVWVVVAQGGEQGWSKQDDSKMSVDLFHYCPSIEECHQGPAHTREYQGSTCGFPAPPSAFSYPFLGSKQQVERKANVIINFGYF